MIIDCHAHVLPHDLPPGEGRSHPCISAPNADGAQTLTIEDVEFLAPRVWFDAGARLEAMDAAGVDIEVVSPMPPLLNYRASAEDALAVTEHINTRVADLVDAGQRRIIGFGTVPLQDPGLATGELRQIVDLGLRGVEVASHVNGVSIGDARFLEFFQEVESLGLAVFVHAIRPPSTDRLPASAGASFGFGVEASFAAASLVMGGTLAACPDLRIAISHGAGGFMTMLGRAQFFATREWSTHEFAPVAADVDAPTPLDLAKRLYYDGLVFDTRILDLIATRVGADRILLGSDFPAIPRMVPATAPLEQFVGGETGVVVLAGSNALSYLAIEESGL
jgi:aminocarboxymuconate-semialdehyde decarboxylase